MPIAEKQLIARIRKLAAAHTPVIVRGIGDDCAVLRIDKEAEALVTTDLSIEGVHFRREWHPPESVGHRCLARGLSDLAAMGGEPVAAFLSLAAPGELSQKWVDGFLRGLTKLARRHGVTLAGGDVSSAPLIAADIMVVGQIPRGTAILRSGARAGDIIYVTGELGASAAALQELMAGTKLRPQDHPQHFFPTPRLAVARVLRRNRLATAMIDISDGLSTDLGHICEESGVGALVQEHSIPRPARARTSTLHLALHGGDDYELLFTASPRTKIPARIAGVRVTRIGQIIRGAKMFLADSHGQRKPLLPRGWQHF
jgi:thiamine-monophosphate kinase